MTSFLKLEPKTHQRPAACPVHGAFQENGGSFFGGDDARVMWFGCPACAKGKQEAEEAEALAKKERERQARLEARLNAAGIPQAFRVRNFDNYETLTPEMEAALRVLREFADNFWTKHTPAGTFLVLAGDRGTGKSHLAIAAAQQVMKRGTAMYTRVGDLIRRVRSTWRRDSPQSEEEVLNMLSVGMDLLVIDEVGVQSGTDDEQRILFDILDRRYAELKPTILLTNLEGKEFAEFIGPRIIDRLRERGMYVRFKWESYRGRVQ